MKILKKFLFNGFYYTIRIMRLGWLKAQGANLSWLSKIDSGCRFFGLEFLMCRGCVRIGPSADIFLIKQHGSFADPFLSFTNNSYIGRNFHLVATSPIKFGENLLIANNVFISNCRHGMELNNLPIIDQKLVDYGPITIGSNVWIGEYSSIIGSLTIGNNVVIGIAERVTIDIPDNSIFKDGAIFARK